MTKLTSQRKYKHSMQYCESCNEYVPDLKRHNKKRHNFVSELEKPMRPKGVHHKDAWKRRRNKKRRT